MKWPLRRVIVIGSEDGADCSKHVSKFSAAVSPLSAIEKRS
jgi:hypothetical protein